MRRTTIFRSELTLTLAALALPLVLAAQEPQMPHRALPPGTQVPAPAPSRAAQPSSPSAPQQAPQGQQDRPADRGVIITSGAGAAQQGTQAAPATHVVAQGETLWALAQQYLGDPLLWPEIYRLNTTVIEDPHWIFPGEELRITATDEPPAAAAASPTTSQSLVVTPQADSTDQNPAPAQGPVSPAGGPTIFSPAAPRARAEVTLGRLAARSYRAVRDGEYYSTGFLTENQPLPSGRIIGDVKTGSRPGMQMAVHQFDDVLVSAPAGDTLQAGNLLLAFRRSDEVGDYGEMVVPTALLRVKGAEEGDHYRATVLRMYATVMQDQEVLDIQPFNLNTNQRAVPVTDGVSGHVIRLRDPHELAQRQQVLFIDKGANDGVRPGDLIQVYATRLDEMHGGTTERDLARGVVVSTRSRTSTVLLVELYSGDVGPSSLVRQIGRMPN